MMPLRSRHRRPSSMMDNSRWILALLVLFGTQRVASLKSQASVSWNAGTKRVASGTCVPNLNSFPSARLSTAAGAAVDVNGYGYGSGPKAEEADGTVLRHTRFVGVGRLYAREIVSDQLADDATSMRPHLVVLERLANATVSVIGIGGVGSWAAEALCRSGVGNLILIDLDDICISNSNRQLHSTSSTIGKLKTDEMKRRLLDINPDCNVTTLHEFVMVDNVHELLDLMLPELDVCLDCIDGAKEKTALLVACTERGVPIVTCGGAGGKMDPTQIVFDDLTRVSDDPLLARCRKNLRQEHGFGQGVAFKDRNKVKKPRKWRIMAIFSTEVPKPAPVKDADVASLRRCDSSLGTACFVTGTFGFVAAGQVVSMLATGKLSRPRKSMT